MSRSNAEREREMIRRIRAVVACKSSRFKDILEAAEINPKSGLRFRNLSGLSFAGQDLRGMDFTGANLCGCDVTDALIEGARFDYSRLGQKWLLRAANGFKLVRVQGVLNLRIAKDWQAFTSQRVDLAAPIFRTDHLPMGSVFQAAHLTPDFIKLPTLKADTSDTSFSCIAISHEIVSHDQLLLHCSG